MNKATVLCDRCNDILFQWFVKFVRTDCFFVLFWLLHAFDFCGLALLVKVYGRKLLLEKGAIWNESWVSNSKSLVE